MTNEKGKSDKVILVIDSTIRVKKNNFLKKWFSRNYRTEKSKKELKEAGYPEGSYEMSADEFISLVEDNLTTNQKFVVKSIKKQVKNGDETIEGFRTTKKIRKKIRSKLLKELDINEETQKLVVSKEDPRTISLAIKELGSSNDNSFEDLGGSDFF